MPPSIAPVRTAEGQAELNRRTRRLSQRHRTMLLMVDGRRTRDQVLRFAAQAGVPAECFDELVGLGLVDALCAEPLGLTLVQDVDLVLESLPGASVDPPLRESVLCPTEAPDMPDTPLEQAREMLLRAVREAAPVSGTLTLFKLKRAASRQQLEALLDEVESRIRKARRQIIAMQRLRQVRHLLSLPAAG